MMKRFVSMSLAIALAFSVMAIPVAAVAADADVPAPHISACPLCDIPNAMIVTVRERTAEGPIYVGRQTCPSNPRFNCPVYKYQYVDKEVCNKCGHLYSTSAPYYVSSIVHDHSAG